MSGHVEFVPADLFDKSTQRWRRVSIGLTVEDPSTPSLPCKGQQQGGSHSRGRSGSHSTDKTLFMYICPPGSTSSHATKRNSNKARTCSSTACSSPTSPTSSVRRPSNLANAAGVAKVCVTAMCPRAAMQSPSLEMRAGLQLKLNDGDAATYYVSHTPRHGSLGTSPSEWNTMAAAAAAAAGGGTGGGEVQTNTTRPFFQSDGYSREGQPFLSRHTSSSGSMLLDYSSTLLHPQGHTPESSHTLMHVDAMEDLFEVEVQGVLTGRHGRALSDGGVKEKASETGGSKKDRRRFSYKKMKKRLLSFVMPSSFRSSEKHSPTTPDVTSFVCASSVDDTLKTGASVLSSSSPAVDVRIRFRSRKALLSILQRYVNAAPRPPAMDDSVQYVDDVPAACGSSRHWEHYLRRRVDPRYDLPFAVPHLYLWHSWLPLATSALYTCDRGLLSVEVTRDTNAPSLSPIEIAKRPTSRQINDSLSHAARTTSWDTVRLVVGTPTSPQPPHGGSSLLHASTYSEMDGAPSPSLRLRDVFLSLSETHLLFHNSFGELKAHIHMNQICGVVFSKASRNHARHLSSMSTYPFVTFLVRAGADEISEPPLAVTFTFLPFTPHQQEVPSSTDSDSSSDESSHSSDEDGDGRGGVASRSGSRGRPVGTSTSSSPTGKRRHHQGRSGKVHKKKVVEMQWLCDRKDQFLSVFRALCPHADKHTIHYDEYVFRHEKRERVRRRDAVEGRQPRRPKGVSRSKNDVDDSAVVLMVGICEQEMMLVNAVGGMQVDASTSPSQHEVSGAGGDGAATPYGFSFLHAPPSCLHSPTNENDLELSARLLSHPRPNVLEKEDIFLSPLSSTRTDELSSPLQTHSNHHHHHQLQQHHHEASPLGGPAQMPTHRSHHHNSNLHQGGTTAGRSSSAGAAVHHDCNNNNNSNSEDGKPNSFAAIQPRKRQSTLLRPKRK